MNRKYDLFEADIYGNKYPITALGRILSAIIAILGIGNVAIPTGIVASSFMEQACTNFRWIRTERPTATTANIILMTKVAGMQDFLPLDFFEWIIFLVSTLFEMRDNMNRPI